MEPFSFKPNPNPTIIDPDTLEYLDKETQSKIVMDILKKIPMDRSQTDIQILVKYTRPLQFFSQFARKKHKQILHAKIIKLVKLEQRPSESVIFYAGDIPDKFYIILKGSVIVSTPKRSTDYQAQRHELGARADPDGPRKHGCVIGGIDLGKNHHDNDKIFCGDTGILLLNFAEEIKVGQMFGHLGLLNNSGRIGTVICKVNCFSGG